jgi:hypothetical protein
MTLRNGHGRGKGQPRIEVLPADELPRGVPAAPPAPTKVVPITNRRSFGAVPAGTPEARALARKGALARWAKAKQLRTLEGLGLKGKPPKALEPYLADAEQFAKYETARLAKTVGGGVCDGAPASMVQSAALQLAGSRAAFASGDMALGSRLADASRQNLLAAHELAAREAVARAASDDARPDPLSVFDDEPGERTAAQ